MKVTIKDIAKKANVSVTTVSRVLNNKPDVGDQTRTKILKLIEELNYKPNSVARGLVMQKTHTIGLIIPDISNPFFPQVARAIEDKAQKSGYSIIFFNTDNHLEKEKKAVELFKSKQVDGLIVSLSLGNEEILKELKAANYPVVQIDRSVFSNSYPLVSIDNKNSAYQMVEYMLKKGYKKIAHITGDLKTTTARDRLAGYKKALNDYQVEINEDYIIKGDYTQQLAFEAMQTLLKLKEPPTAVFAANDLSAAGVYKALFAAGLNIPADIAVAGHDDIDIASLLRPELTTMRQPKYSLGEKAVSVLLKMIDNYEAEVEAQILKTKLVIRESV
ncbi:LacI family DNA-binding transcriptional regulator [Halanaerobium praevalens]|uniref:Transcriptional regulator, LacI family n=1 Tax=Halanaerobium praevalens (strain ATCC 33744 / DSM 2228 / GSL) TaxID=572479 RepID=E3DLT1_HALPG|nr:LacI family DNA-binding transcriptional regulator [Halanaerobium praevalens]ADO77278.1 transcriptional regulator, LacI family [Halanaerobium praevalens DSM 2228]